MLRDYEITFVLSTTLDEEASAATLERVNQLIVNGSGTVNEVHAWGRRHLAYPIEHQRDGFYITTRFSMPTGSVAALDNDLRLNESILRHLIVRQDEVPLKPMMPGSGQGAPAQTSAPAARDAELPSEDAPVATVLESIDEEVVPAAVE